MALLLSATLVFSGCGNMNNTAKGGLIRRAAAVQHWEQLSAE
mgnify:CR=1 FL=1